jgi:hypothetical protein
MVLPTNANREGMMARLSDIPTLRATQRSGAFRNSAMASARSVRAEVAFTRETRELPSHPDVILAATDQFSLITDHEE